MSRQSYYIRPDEMFTLDGNVATGSGFDSPAYAPEYATDGRPDTPARFTTGDGSVTITNTARIISAVGIAFHNVTVTTGVTGGVSATIPAAADRPNGIPFNSWKQVAETSVSTLTYAITSNPAGTVIVGEYIAGKLRTFPGGGILAESSARQMRNMKSSSGQGRKRPLYDTGEVARTFVGSAFGTISEADDLMLLYESQDNENRYIAFIPNSDINDMWIVTMDEPQFEYSGYDLVKMSIPFIEIQRGRW